VPAATDFGDFHRRDFEKTPVRHKTAR